MFLACRIIEKRAWGTNLRFCGPAAFWNNVAHTRQLNFMLYCKLHVLCTVFAGRVTTL